MSKQIIQAPPEFKYFQISLLSPGLLFIAYLFFQLVSGSTKEQTLTQYKSVISLFNLVYITVFLASLGLLVFFWKTNKLRERLLVSGLIIYLFFGFILVSFAYGLASGIFDLFKGFAH